jgi:hypothetical protein
MTFDETVKDYDDSLNAVVYRQVPEACDTISVNMGDNVDIFLTLDHSRVPVRETMLADSTDVVIEEIIE